MRAKVVKGRIAPIKHDKIGKVFRKLHPNLQTNLWTLRHAFCHLEILVCPYSPVGSPLGWEFPSFRRTWVRQLVATFNSSPTSEYFEYLLLFLSPPPSKSTIAARLVLAPMHFDPKYAIISYAKDESLLFLWDNPDQVIVQRGRNTDVIHTPHKYPSHFEFYYFITAVPRDRQWVEIPSMDDLIEMLQSNSLQRYRIYG